MKSLIIKIFVSFVLIFVFLNANGQKIANTVDTTEVIQKFNNEVGRVYKIEDPLERLVQYRSIVNKYSYQLPNRTIELGFRAVEIARSLKDTSKLGFLLLNIANNMRLTGQYDSSMQILKEVEVIEKTFKDPRLKTMMLIGIGQLYYTWSDNKKSMEYCLEALAIADNNHDTLNLIQALNTMAVIHYNQGAIDKALGEFEICLRYSRARKDTTNTVTLYNNLGAIYKEKEKCEKALIYFAKAMEMGTYNLAKPLINSGQCFIKLGQYDKAEEMLNAALSVKMQEEPLNKVMLYGTLGELYRAKGQFGKSLKMLDKGMEYAEQLGFMNSVMDIHHGFSQTYEEMGNYKEAFYHQQEFRAIQDSVYEKSHNELIAEMEGKYESARKQSRIDQLRRETQIADHNLEKEKSKKNYLILGLILISVGLLVIFYFYYQKRKLNLALEQQKYLVEEQNSMLQTSIGEKNTLLKEVHHRVKNNLQIISSLMSLQSINIQDNPEVLKALNDARARIESMSLIHQHLYMSDNLKEIDCKKYFSELSFYLESLMQADKNVVFAIETKGIKLNVDTIIPLGIVVNELMTNSIKYAFDEVDEAIITIGMDQVGDRYHLHFSDNGKGLPDDFEPANSTSLGIKLVNLLSKKLKGEIQFENRDGLYFSMNFQMINE